MAATKQLVLMREEMKIGDFEFLIVSYDHEEELVAEVSKYEEGLDLATVRIAAGTPVISIGPTPAKDTPPPWTIDYHTFKQIIAALDDFLVSIGYPPDEPIEDEV